MSHANLAGRADAFPLPGTLAVLAFRPSRELAAFLMETLARGRVSSKMHGGDQREVSNLHLFLASPERVRPLWGQSLVNLPQLKGVDNLGTSQSVGDDYQPGST